MRLKVWRSFLCIGHPIAHTQLVDDVVVFTGAAAKLFADIGHIHLKLLDAAAVGAAPDLADDIGVGEHLASMTAQKCQNIIFCLGNI